MYIYYLHIDEPIWNATDTHLLGYVSEKRREKIIHYKFDIDRKLSLYAALMSYYSISSLSHIPLNQISIQSTPNQKPTLLFPAGYYFSISHTRNFVLCAVSQNTDIGADVEKIGPAPFEIIPSAFSPEETAYLNSVSLLKKEETFYKIWTLKEAYSKFLGLGLKLDFRSFSTLSPAFSSHSLTIKTSSYLCSFYSEDMTTVSMHELTVPFLFSQYTAFQMES